MGRRGKRQGKNINGILILDKALGLSSNAALQQVKRLLQAAKAGHTGSLDPLATGVLPLCFGKATRISSYLLNANKTYIATMKLGEASDTGDAEGQIIQSMPVPELDAQDINTVLMSFTGESLQIPPMYSALKQQGIPLYKLATQGITVERPARKIHIYVLHLLDWHDGLMRIEVCCSKGTYIRVLAEDIAKQLGSCAHLVALQRTVSGPFALRDAITFSELEQLSEQEQHTKILSSETALPEMPVITLTAEQKTAICYGQSINKETIECKGQKEEKFRVRLHAKDGLFIGIGQIDKDKIRPEKLFWDNNPIKNIYKGA